MKIRYSTSVNLFLSTILIVASFMIGSTTSSGVYDPFVDLNHDGYINAKDAIVLGSHFGAFGDVGVGITNGDFEFGTLDGWEIFLPAHWYSPQINTTTVHNGSFSAFISDGHTNSWIRQPLSLYTPIVAANGIILEGWIYPLRVGLLSEEYPYSGIVLRFYNKSSRQPAFAVVYSWCKASFVNISDAWFFLPSFNASEWNFFSRNVIADIYSWRPYIGSLEDTVLYSIEATYHYSNGNPGAFYVDDLEIFAG